jgi:ABC-type amino acid transport substrate-binding protein
VTVQSGPPPTIEPGTLAVASALPDPPFELRQDNAVTGFDIELMRAICGVLGVEHTIVEYRGHDFNGIFDGLREHTYDAVISGTTITPERQQAARFTNPYLESGQSLVVNTKRTPQIRSTADLSGQVVRIQVGNTSDIVARKLEAEGAIAGIRYYAYGGIIDALDDVGLCSAINAALVAVERDGAVDRLRRRWLQYDDGDPVGAPLHGRRRRVPFQGSPRATRPGRRPRHPFGRRGCGDHRWRLIGDEPWRRVYVAF